MGSAGWRCLVAALSFLPVLGAFTTTRIFFVRDLSFFFWSRHLWFRHTVLTGQWPWWDPFVASGQSAIADALNQLVMPITLAVRLLPSDVISFNLWVALPLPIAALGMFAFLRRHVPDAAAALGACVFALSGPVVSSLNSPNLSWSVAFIPWVFWGAEVGGAALAVTFALQALCGEPVTWVSTGLVVACWIFRLKPEATNPIRDTIHRLAHLAVGGLLAAAQLVPTLLAGMRAHRAAIATPDFWSLHPLSLWDAVAPNLFGNYYDAFLADLPWMGALNFGRDPFFYSLYVGPIVVVLAAAGLASGSKHRAFWLAVAVGAIACSLGGYTPIYPLLRRLVPPLTYFRFPVKYIVFAIFAVAVLAAQGFAHFTRVRHLAVPILAAGLIGAGLAAAAFAMPGTVQRVTHALALSTHLKYPAAGAEFLARSAPPLAARMAALLLAAGVLLASAARVRYVNALVFAAVCADLVIINAPLNLTMPIAVLAPPPWYTAMSGPPLAAQRIYIGGRVRGYMNGGDPDGVKAWQIPAEATAIEGRMELNALLPMAPSGWGVREALSYDLPYLWPAEYDATVRRFEAAGKDERAAFLRRSAVRRCVLPDTETRQFRVVDDVSDWNMRVFECNPGAQRAYVAWSVDIAPDQQDLTWPREGLFDVASRDDHVRLSRLPAAAGTSGPPAEPSVRIVSDLGTSVTLDVALRAEGVLVLRDTFDPSWHATVDGRPAEIVRANGIHRAVSLRAGRHVVRFFYRPRDFTIGLIMSVATALVLIVSARRPRRRAGERGFTLIELMIVLAILGILLAIAFTEYRGMQAKGNEASAIGSMRSIATAQAQFSATCANGKFATALPGLGQPVPVTGHAFLSPDLTSTDKIEKSGYLFQMVGKPSENASAACNGAAVADGWAATADPLNPGVTGTLFYAINTDRILYSDPEKTFTEDLPETGPPGHGAEVQVLK